MSDATKRSRKVINRRADHHIMHEEEPPANCARAFRRESTLNFSRFYSIISGKTNIAFRYDLPTTRR
ncbi:hypothetical protein Trydic_g8881 [Trypoxylus dichotomus]